MRPRLLRGLRRLSPLGGNPSRTSIRVTREAAARASRSLAAGYALLVRVAGIGPHRQGVPEAPLSAVVGTHSESEGGWQQARGRGPAPQPGASKRTDPFGRARAGSRCGVGGARASSAAMACVCGSGLALRHGLEAARGRRQAPCPAQHRACGFSSRGGAGDGALWWTGPGFVMPASAAGGGGVLATPRRVRDGPRPEGRGSAMRSRALAAAGLEALWGRPTLEVARHGGAGGRVGR
jgi:hypothetical protein